MIIAEAGFTQGTNIWMTCNGFIIDLKENIYRETPTSVIAETYQIFTKSQEMVNYFNIMDSFGYDMMCKMHGSLNKMIKNGILTAKEQEFWSNELKNRLFTDTFHIKNHICSLCSNSETGLFHPKLEKFKYIFETMPNHLVCEQTWRTFNKLKFMKGFCKEKYRLFLILFKRNFNKKRKKQLRKKFYFTSITDVEKLRNYSIKNNSKKRSWDDMEN